MPYWHQLVRPDFPRLSAWDLITEELPPWMVESPVDWGVDYPLDIRNWVGTTVAMDSEHSAMQSQDPVVAIFHEVCYLRHRLVIPNQVGDISRFVDP